MARVKVCCPRKPSFMTRIPIFIGHINYGGHLANDAVLSIAHEARLRYFKRLGFTEKDAFGTGLIMTDSAVVYKNEAFQGETLAVEVVAYDISSLGFDLYYSLSCEREDRKLLIAEMKTGMVCFDYEKRRVERLPDRLKEVLTQ